MTFLADMQSDLDAIYEADEFAEDITLGGVAGIRAIVNDPQETSEQTPRIDTVGLSISVRVSEVVSVARSTVAIVRGVSYLVQGHPQSDRLEWQLELRQQMVSL
jgi:hypothetical protein